MAEYLLNEVYTLLDDQTISATTNSVTLDLSKVSDTVAFNMWWENGSSLNADISIQVANVDSASWWTNITSTITNITAATGKLAISVISGHRYMRLTVTITAGSADFNANVFAKPTTVRGS